MTIAHLLEDFGNAGKVQPVQTVSDELLEEEKLVSFENGYTAGWDDAVGAQDSETTKISATLANSLEDMSFTFHEAQSQLIESLDPMLKVLTSAILPDAMAASFGHHIVDQLTDMAKGQTTQPLVISVAAGEAAGVRSALNQNFSVEVKVREAADLAPGQAYLRVGNLEREINSAALLDSIRDSVDAFSYQVKEDANYG
ncbi:ABC transporter ATP-binding protein [Parasedimentitalea maritima]|uniref:ABC transporter ATP-binding protein n=1 Tax=Parasedimentitalea maritima TaxID=2578117 RepID=A0A5R8ZL59_9RHOB|nr:ABC transporter ATP-binding protein [Zongyanglinia marina]KAE9630797.1 ABC transporter ATP-binding protein [Zongyanglinia marina]TLP65576.1 ABC transporter ATP-binding protein [Zongyanglinia marina]